MNVQNQEQFNLPLFGVRNKTLVACGKLERQARLERQASRLPAERSDAA
jgi:hypothetical protein